MPLSYDGRYSDCARGGGVPWGLAVAGGCSAGREDVQVDTETRLRRAATQVRKDTLARGKLRAYRAAKEARLAAAAGEKVGVTIEIHMSNGGPAQGGTCLRKPRPRRRGGVREANLRTYRNHVGAVLPSAGGPSHIRQYQTPDAILHPKDRPKFVRKKFGEEDAGGIPSLSTAVGRGEITVEVLKGGNGCCKVVVRHAKDAKAAEAWAVRPESTDGKQIGEKDRDAAGWEATSVSPLTSRAPSWVAGVVGEEEEDDEEIIVRAQSSLGNRISGGGVRRGAVTPTMVRLLALKSFGERRRGSAGTIREGVLCKKVAKIRSGFL